MDKQKSYLLFGSILSVLGFGLVAWKAGLVMTFGLFLIFWGNNIERRFTNKNGNW